MTDTEVLEMMKSDTPLAKARTIFSSECARIEQACSQRSPLSIFDLRRMEFEAVSKIANTLGVMI
jgi:hypothetical protein